jgi:hypothetical protein
VPSRTSSVTVASFTGSIAFSSAILISCLPDSFLGEQIENFMKSSAEGLESDKGVLVSRYLNVPSSKVQEILKCSM